MDVIEYIRRQVAGARRLTDAVMQDTTDEQLNWAPPGTANPISATLVHLLATEDSYVQRMLQGKPRLWESEGWGEKVGLTNAPSSPEYWEEIKSKTVPLAPLLAYARAVHAATDGYLDRLTPEELDRTVSFYRGERPAADVLVQVVNHAASHAGDVAAVKGMQGVKGLPF